LTDPDWIERIKAGVENRLPVASNPPVEEYAIKVYFSEEEQLRIIEFRPRAGTWQPAVCGVPLGQKDELNVSLKHGPRGRILSSSVSHSRRGESKNGIWWLCYESSRELSPTYSGYLIIRSTVKPHGLIFGESEGKHYILTKDELDRLKEYPLQELKRG
jgi:hypothetical protein